MDNVLTVYGSHFAEKVKIDQEMRMIARMEQDACFVYVNKGRHDVISPNEHLKIEEHESALMKCGNYVACAVDTSPINPLEMIVFHLDPEAIKKSFGAERLSELIKDVEVRSEISSVKIDTNPLLENFIESLEVYFNHPAMATDDMLSVKLQELVLILCQSQDKEVIKYLLSNLYKKIDHEFDRVIETHLYNNLSIPELAALTNRSESTFKRDFKKYYKESPARYIKNKKLEKAEQLLMQTELSISEITYDSGFENPAHFSTSFVEKFGQSPKNYRVTQKEKSLA